VAPADGELVLEKASPNSFVDTALAALADGNAEVTSAAELLSGD